MPQIHTSIGEHTIEELEKMVEKTGKSFSRVVSEMIELGLKLTNAKSESQMSEGEKKKAELQEKHTEYMLRTMNLCGEILRCVFQEGKTESKLKDPEKVISEVKDKMQFYIKSYIGSEQ